jgi:hypothetical protein
MVDMRFIDQVVLYRRHLIVKVAGICWGPTDDERSEAGIAYLGAFHGVIVEDGLYK